MTEDLNQNEAENLLKSTPVAEPDAAMPDGLPQKFWDETAGNVRLSAMIKSYGDLERKLGAQVEPDVPGSPEEYDVGGEDLPLGVDADVNARLHQAGFTREQARMVYQLANEKLLPMVAGIAQDYEAEAQVERLETHFGGAHKWREISRQLQVWGQANLPGDVYDALSTTRDGVLTLHRMMETGEPGIGAGAGIANGGSEGSVKDLMNSPGYWRDRDPAVVEKVRQGFRSLYPES